MSEKLLDQLEATLTANHLKLAAAESCTGGWIAKSITDKAGSSVWFDMAVVSYSNEAKTNILKVSPDTLEEHGAVSEQTVIEMVEGLLEVSSADIGVAVSGIAGPGGGTEDKPVGTVCFAWALRGQAPRTAIQHFEGDREEVRRLSVECALNGCLHQID